jgi:tetratricopeptide (TPR) repeat protein
MWQVRLLKQLEFLWNGEAPALTDEQRQALVFLAASDEVRTHSELETSLGAAYHTTLESLEGIQWSPQGAQLKGSSDVLLYRASSENLRDLHRLKGEFAPGCNSSQPIFQAWLEDQRFEIERIFLEALLRHAAGLEEKKRVAEATKNLEYVHKVMRQLEPKFAAKMQLELSKYHWRLKRLPEAILCIESALPQLDAQSRLEASVNHAAALVRVGRLEDALNAISVLPDGEAQGWALLHRANALFYLERLEEALSAAQEAYRVAAKFEDGFLAMSALTVQGEVLLEQAIIGKTEPKEAAIALGKAIGIAEVLDENASALTLATLAHTHLIWGAKQKALEMAERAFKRARTAKDGTATIRALLALFAITKIGSFARNALTEARAVIHTPLEVRAMLALAEKDGDMALSVAAVAQAQHIKAPRLAQQAQALLEQLRQKQTV